jgi:hypothetical protein
VQGGGPRIVTETNSRGAKIFSQPGVALVLAGCALLFALGVIFRLNGSSSALWLHDLREPNQTKGLILGAAKATRSDEWMVWTPAVLAQLRHKPPMPIENRSLGAGAAPLLMSIPVRHYSMLFRPQLWGFFFLDVERGFAWLWNAKIFGLLASMFLLLLVLVRGSVQVALFGSIAISYSSFVQWWFSSPPMLPEMLSSWALALISGWLFFSRARSRLKLVAAVVLIASAINFVLCCYPPFQVPLAYLALFLFAAFLWQRRKSPLLPGFLWLGACAAAVALLLWPTFRLCRPTLEMISQTSYPGTRRNFGGGMSPLGLFSGALNFFDSEGVYPDLFANASEASNFFPLWVAAGAVVVFRWARTGRRPEPVVAALFGCILLFSVYSILGVPPWFGRATGLSFCMQQRTLLAIGLAGMLLVFVTLRAGAPALNSSRRRLFATLGMAAVLLAYLLCVEAQAPRFLSPSRFSLLLAAGTLLSAAYFSLKPQLFAALFAGALLLNNFLVNPVNQGLPGLLEPAAGRRIASLPHRAPEARWAVYEQSTLAQFLISRGATVFNGVKAVPQLDILRKLDPNGDALSVYNRYAFIVLGLPREKGAEPRFEAVIADIYRAYVSPQEPALRDAGLKYVVFRRALDDDEAAGLRLVEAMAENKIWIYELL